MKPQLIAIDGPVAVGKSSVGSRLARRLGYVFFDTGMIYRAFTWKVLKSGISIEDEQKICQLANTTKFNFVPLQGCYLSPFIDDEDVSSKLLRPEVEAQVSLISKIPEVRQTLIQEQRRLAQRGKLVMPFLCPQISPYTLGISLLSLWPPSCIYYYQADHDPSSRT